MKGLKLILTSLSVFLFLQIASAQPICGFDELHKKRLKENSGYRENVLANETQIQNYIREHRSDLLRTTSPSSVNSALYTIPVVVHVVNTGGAIGSIYNPSDAQITGAINYLNQVFDGTYPGTEGVGDLQVQFVLATRDPNCNPTTGINRIDGSSLTNYVSNGVNASTSGGVSDLALKNFVRWDPSNFYNIWVVNRIDSRDGTSGQFISGYAYFAGASASLDGTVMLATQMAAGRKTLPHEIGHALNLYHPFEESADAGSCPANANCNTQGDRVCDTDPITYNQTAGVIDFTCRSGTNSCTGTTYVSNTEKNYMNYTSCYTLFTAGQKARMLAAMSLPGRASLVSSWALGGVYPMTPYIAPGTASCTPVTGATGLSNYFAGLINVSTANKSFSSGPSRDDGGYVDRTDECLYMIQLQQGNTYTFSASLLGANREQLRAWIDYNNDGIFNNATEQIYYNADIPIPGSGYTNVSGTFTVPATASTNTILRMRVLEELSTVYGAGLTITGACYNPTYGQAEDYPVFLSATLPVKLQYFKGVKQNTDVLLSWETSFEQNVKEFQIEKSSDGASFTKIGNIAAANISTGKTYSFTDKNVTGTVNYYRLKQIDRDEKSQLSEVVVIKSDEDILSKIKILNNPFGDDLKIAFNIASVSVATIKLYDISGRKLYNGNYKVTGNEQINIDFSRLKLKQGVYIAEVRIGNEVVIKKLIKQ